jgi:hypothetical protein
MRSDIDYDFDEALGALRDAEAAVERARYTYKDSAPEPIDPKDIEQAIDRCVENYTKMRDRQPTTAELADAILSAVAF